MNVLAGAKIGSAKVGKDSVAMTVEAGGAKNELKVDVVLVAAGRAPVVEDIGLKEAGVQLTERGFIKIDEQFRTTAKGVFAIGDVAGSAWPAAASGRGWPNSSRESTRIR